MSQPTYHTYSFELVVVIQEEAQILERNVDVAIATLRSMLLNGLTTAAKCVFLDLKAIT